MKKQLTRAQVRQIVDETYCEIARIAQMTSEWDRAIEAARKGEREHLRFGARLLGRKPKRQQSIETTARYFASRWFLESADWTADQAVDAREDARLAYCTRRRVERYSGTYGDCDVAAHLATLTLANFPAFAHLDYAQQFAVRE